MTLNHKSPGLVVLDEPAKGLLSESSAPPPGPNAERRGRYLCLVALLLAALNLRPAVTTMAAVMVDVGAGFGLSDGQMLVLSMLPVLAFGATAPLAGILARRLGVNNAMGWALLVLAFALVARVSVGALLLPATFLSGAAIMVVSVLIPQALKAHKANGWWTGLASVGYGIGAALGAGLIHPVADFVAGSLRLSLGLWSVPAVAAAALMFLATRRIDAESALRGGPDLARPAGGQGSRALLKLLRQPLAIALTGFFGLQALLYFSVTAWLPSLLMSRGVSGADAALMLAWFSIAGFVPTFLMPVLAARPRWLRILPAGIGIAVLLGFLWLMVAEGSQLFAVVGFLGATESAAFGLALALVVLRSSDAPTAGAMSALAQGGGFAMAAGGPLLIGAVHQGTGAWLWPVVLLAAFAALLAVVGLAAVRGRQITLG